MSDQPKPRKQDAATPTTSEWTADHVRCVIDEIGWQGLANAHNTALAAALTQLHDEWWERVQDANKQLAAERERYVKIESQLKAHSSALEAEREKSQKLVEYGVKLDDWNDKLQEQLAAEREKVENLRYALAKMEGK